MNVEKVASAVFMKFNEYEHRVNVLMILTVNYYSSTTTQF